MGDDIVLNGWPWLMFSPGQIDPSLEQGF